MWGASMGWTVDAFSAAATTKRAGKRRPTTSQPSGGEVPPRGLGCVRFLRPPRGVKNNSLLPRDEQPASPPPGGSLVAALGEARAHYQSDEAPMNPEPPPDPAEPPPTPEGALGALPPRAPEVALTAPQPAVLMMSAYLSRTVARACGFGTA